MVGGSIDFVVPVGELSVVFVFHLFVLNLFAI